MMKLGVTGAFGFDDFPQPSVLRHYASAGCQVLQVYRNRLQNIPAAEILATVRDLPLPLDSIDGHFGDDVHPSSEYDSIRRNTVDLYRREADYCRQLGGELVVVHPCPSRISVGNLETKHSQLRRSFDE